MTTQTKAVKTFRAPADYGNRCAFTVTAEVHGQPPYFAVTGDIYNKSVRTRNGDGTQACGCLHAEAAKAWPKIKPIIALHLSDSETGEPMHAEANGYYWLAGVVGGLGEQYYGDKAPADCLRILAKHLRLTEAEAQAIADKVKAAFDAPYVNDEPTLRSSVKYAPTAQDKAKAASTLARNTFHAFIVAQRDRWQSEANAGLELIRSLNT